MGKFKTGIMEILKLELERLKEEERVWRNAFSENKKKQNEIRVALFKEKTGLRVGDRLRLKSGASGEITEFWVKFSSVHPVICYYEKDGTLGKRQSVLYDWDIRDAVIEKSGETD